MSVLWMNEQRERMVRDSMELLQDAMVAGDRSWREKDRHETVRRQNSPRNVREVRCYMYR